MNKKNVKEPDPRYSVWKGIKQRCNNPNNPKYSCYGGRGIKMCDRWEKYFTAFCLDMGARPSLEHCIDRIDNEKGYEPENCRWVTWDFSRKHRRPILNFKEPSPFVRKQILFALCMRYCGGCQILKELSAFSKCASHYDGVSVRCKVCISEKGQRNKGKYYVKQYQANKRWRDKRRIMLTSINNTRMTLNRNES